MKLSPVLAVAGGLALAAAVVTLAGQEVATAKGPPLARTCDAGVVFVCDAIDRSAAGKGSGRYRRVEVSSQDCAQERPLKDGGRALEAETLAVAPASTLEILKDSCRPAASETGTRATDAGVKYLAQACACRRAAGTCQYRTDAGTLAAAPMGRTLGPGYPPYTEFTGAGCEPKSCVELLGESSWPAACPGG